MTRGDQTRERLLDAAEQLFGDRGVGNVSLRQIRLAAGQGNAAVVQYHFGDRNGMLEALAARHAPRITALQVRLLNQVGPAAEREPAGLRRLVAAFVRPLAEYVTAGPGERAWVKISAELTAHPRVSLDELEARVRREAPPAAEIGRRLFDVLCRSMPAAVAAERVYSVFQFAVHWCAVRARILDDPHSSRSLTSDEDFAENLVDMCTGALTAPVHRAEGSPGIG